jgi:hypothetical protein
LKITFECKDSLYRWLCDVEEYFRSTPDLRGRKVESFDDVITTLFDLGIEYLSLHTEKREVAEFLAKRWGAIVSLDESGNVHMFFPEKPKEKGE